MFVCFKKFKVLGKMLDLGQTKNNFNISNK